MRIPDRLAPLLDMGLIEEVHRPLMSGKEADVYLVTSEGQLRVAKIYKEASNRSFKHRADYTEGRKVKNTRTQRAMDKRSRFGRAQIEAAWQSAEVDAIRKLFEADVRVPEPHHFVDGVLVMELITGPDGGPAPRLVDLHLTPEEAEDLFQRLLKDIVKMLLAGVVHGDLSDFNILVDAHGPVIIDLPQAVDPAFNRNARKLFIRDVDNVTRFLAKACPKLRRTRYGLEIWDLYERNDLHAQSRLTGRAPKKRDPVDTSPLMREIEALEREAQARREAAGIVRKKKFEKPKPSGPPPKPLKPLKALPSSDTPSEGAKKKRRRRRRKPRSGSGPTNGSTGSGSSGRS